MKRAFILMAAGTMLVAMMASVAVAEIVDGCTSEDDTLIGSEFGDLIRGCAGGGG